MEPGAGDGQAAGRAPVGVSKVSGGWVGLQVGLYVVVPPGEYLR